MITEIPTASEFQAAGLNQLYLAWQIATQAVADYEDVTNENLEDYIAVDDVDKATKQAASVEYWAKSQPALANAFGLIQQAMEMALKGRIASISPFLLISHDPKDWPKGSDTVAVPFSDFRTLDAADLVKVHNTFSAAPLDAHFRSFWDSVRRDRNKIMHSVSPKLFDPATLVRTILTAAQVLFADVRWPQRLLDMEDNDKYAAFGSSESTQNRVLRQIDIAIRHLTPAESRLFFGYDVKRRSYLCPTCHYRANHHGAEFLPALAHFSSKSAGERTLWCAVCNETVEVERSACTQPDCQGDVIHDGTCLTCRSPQDSPYGFRSALLVEEPARGQRYWFLYGRNAQQAPVEQHLVDDDAAREHARLALLSTHLRSWDTVTIYQHNSRTRFPSTERGSPWGRLLGAWSRQEGRLIWEQGYKFDVFGERSL